MYDHISDTDMAYLAGIIDGEGCLSITGRFQKYGQLYTLMGFVSITNTSRALISWIESRIPIGRLYTKNDEYHLRTCYYWRLCKQEPVRELCRVIAPRLIVKREQAELIGKGWANLDNAARFALVDRVQDLKRI